MRAQPLRPEHKGSPKGKAPVGRADEEEEYPDIADCEANKHGLDNTGETEAEERALAAVEAQGRLDGIEVGQPAGESAIEESAIVGRHNPVLLD